MRTLPSHLAQSIATGVTHLCSCWRLTRRDGMVFGFTDHDRDLSIAGTLFEAASGLEASETENQNSLAAGGGEVSGALSSARLLPEEIEAGLYDGARLERFLVDWMAPLLDFRIDVAILGEIRRADEEFVAETRNAFAALDQEKGRLYSPTCSADLGDAQCRVDLTQAPRRIATLIASTDGRTSLTAPAFAAANIGDFARGLVQFTSGANAGLIVSIKNHHEGGVLELWQSLVRPMAIGDGVIARAGCDKTFATCRDRFQNAANFRGFPFIPTPDFVLSYARPGEGIHQGRPLVR